MTESDRAAAEVALSAPCARAGAFCLWCREVRPDKAAAVAELAEEFRSSAGAVLTEYRGLSVSQLQELRRALGEHATYAVVKNTLTKIAAKQAGVDAFEDLLVGPSAIAFIKGDVVEATKGLRDFARTNSPLVIKGGVLDGKTLTLDEIAKLADLESREALLAKLAGALMASMQNAAYLFNAPLTKTAQLAAALAAKAEQDPSILAGGQGEPTVEELPDSAAEAFAEETAGATAEGAAEATAEDTPEATAEDTGEPPETADASAERPPEVTAEDDTPEPKHRATTEG